MIRLLAYLAIVATAVTATVWLAERGGEATMVWGDWEIATTLPVLALAAGLFALAVAAALAAAGWLLRSPGRLRGALARRRHEKGQAALVAGLLAAAAGDGADARRQGRRAAKLLGQPPLALLLTAQAAGLDGDIAAAERAFQAMLERSETRFLGLRGLTAAALARGDREAARGFAERAHGLRPGVAWVSEALFELQARAGDWAAAGRTLAAARRRRLGDRDGARRRRAALLVEEGRRALGELKRAEAIQHARRAHREAPALVAATALLARLLIDERKPRDAARAIEKSWAAAPHPELAKLYLEAGPDDAGGRYKRIGKLATLAPGHRESRLAVAQAALAAGLTGQARRHLEGLAPVTRRIAQLWARLEEAEGDGEAAAMWTARGGAADPEPLWRCDRCDHGDEDWHAVCRGCGAFDTASWRPPGQTAAESGDAPLLLTPAVGG